MLKKEIQIGGLYNAKVSGKLTVVRVDNITEHDPSFGVNSYRRSKTQTIYHVTNTSTGRKITFRSATKFRGLATPSNNDRPLSLPIKIDV